ncbi:MAG: hypothetical protein R3300_19280 [Candidatus Promineifilaceae bacterium]|nr:hypothetical protein [Candidatus Promineifilaceae bacterium]
MSSGESWKTWAIVVALLLFAGVASAVVPFLLEEIDLGGSESLSIEEEPEPIVIMIEDYVLGQELLGLPLLGQPANLPVIGEVGPLDGLELSQFQATGILLAIVLFVTVAAGVPLAFIYVRLDNTVDDVLEDESFSEARSALQEKEKAKLKERQEGQPAQVGQPEDRRARWAAFLTSLIVLLFAWFSAAGIGRAIYGEEEIVLNGNLVSPASTFTLIVVAVTAVILIIYYSQRDPAEVDLEESDRQPVNWGWLWVILSGVLIVGVGTGLAFALTAG